MKIAIIHQPAKNVMQSGKSKDRWLLEYATDSQYIDNIMGWSGSTDTKASEVKLSFENKEEAIKYAEEAGIQYKVIEPNERKKYIKNPYTKIFLDKPHPKCEF